MGRWVCQDCGKQFNKKKNAEAHVLETMDYVYREKKRKRVKA